MASRACGVPAARLSAFLDGALSHRDRERLAVHALGCSDCRDELYELRRTRDLLRGSACAAPADRLAARLMAIPQEHRPGPSRRARRLRTLVAAAVVGLLTFGGTASAAGWAAAPAPGATVDPGLHGEDEYIAVETTRPLGSHVVAAVMALDDDALSGPYASIAPRPVSPGAALDATGVEQVLSAVDAAAGHVTLDGEQEVRVDHGGALLQARAAVRTRAGQGTHVTVKTLAGATLSDTFTPIRGHADHVLTELAADQRVTARTGQSVAGREAVLLQVSGRDGLEARWWIDAASGVQLWREIWSGGAPRESVGFSRVRIGDSDDFMAHLQPQLSVPVTTSTMTLSSTGGLTAQGWECRHDLAGLPLVQLRRDDRSDVLHTVYGGAGRTVSVVQQRGALAEEPAGFVRGEDRVWISDGWPAQATWQSGDTVFTVTADSADQVAEVTAELPHERPVGRAPWDRVRAGWMRVGDIVFG